MAPTAAVSGQPRATRRDWLGLAVLALPCLLYAMDLTVLNLAVPALSADLRPTSVQLLWIVDIYGFMLAGSLITMGALGDRIGRRRLLLAGSVAFGVASVLAAFSASAEMLIATRALLGVAGATLAPSTLSLIRNMFLDPKQRAVAIAVWITSFSAGGALGPPLGGVLLRWFWWGSVFLLAVPVMAVLLVVGPRLLPEFRDPAPGRLDVRSAVLSLAAVLAVVYGVKELAQDGLDPLPLLPVLSVLAGLALGVLFVRRQHTLPDPLLDLRLFRVPAFSAALATYTLGILLVIGVELFLAQYLQLVLGLTALHAALWSVPGGLGFVVGSMLAPMLASRVHPASVITAGLGLAAVGFGLLTQLDATDATAGLTVLVAGTVVFSLGIAPAATLATDLVVGAAPPERAGAAAAISETGSELGGALGIAIMGVIGTGVYRGRVAAAVPAGVPHEAAVAARDTLGGAVSAVGQLPDRLGDPLLDTAREAFTQGLHVAAAISAAIAVGGAVLAAVLLRGGHTGVEPEGQRDPEQQAVTAGDGAVPTPPVTTPSPVVSDRTLAAPPDGSPRQHVPTRRTRRSSSSHERTVRASSGTSTVAATTRAEDVVTQLLDAAPRR
jgi:DHA2 family multidrug resistance protein-like MFS transporter